MSNYNLFHLESSQRLEMSWLTNKEFVGTLTKALSNTVFVLIGDTEKNVIDAWKLLKAQDVMNLYMLSGGIDSWLKIFPVNENIAKPIYDRINKNIINGYLFSRAVGDSEFSSYPIDPLKETSKSNILYEKKV